MSYYKHLNINERESIFLMQSKGMSFRQIAKELNRSVSTISRELSKNSSRRKAYSPSKATKNYLKRRKKCRRKFILSDLKVKEKVQYLFLEKQWSPEQISNRLKHENSPISISYTTIYRGIYSGLLEVKTLNWKERGVARKLRHRGKTRHSKGKIETRGKIQISNHIESRPKGANSRCEVGHWEIDTVLGKINTGCLVTLADRKTRYYIAERVERQSSKDVSEKLIEIISKLDSNKVKTFTSDRGKEFSKHSIVTKETGIPFYFAKPHAPWQRPTNENFNGLLREYMPKGSDFTSFSDEDINSFVFKLNTRPRKCLNWKTPAEVFFKKVLHLT